MIGLLSVVLAYNLIRTHLRAGNNRKMLKVHLFLSALLMPLVAACTILSMTTMPDTPIEIPQVRSVLRVRVQLIGHL